MRYDDGVPELSAAEYERIRRDQIIAMRRRERPDVPVECYEQHKVFADVDDARAWLKENGRLRAHSCMIRRSMRTGQKYFGYHWCIPGQKPIRQVRSSCKKVICDTGEIFPSATIAAEKYNECGSHTGNAIRMVCKGEYETAYGHKWEFYEGAA